VGVALVAALAHGVPRPSEACAREATLKPDYAPAFLRAKAYPPVRHARDNSSWAVIRPSGEERRPRHPRTPYLGSLNASRTSTVWRLPVNWRREWKEVATVNAFLTVGSSLHVMLEAPAGGRCHTGAATVIRKAHSQQITDCDYPL
jgi:hypothetical protein